MNQIASWFIKNFLMTTLFLTALPFLRKAG